MILYLILNLLHAQRPLHPGAIFLHLPGDLLDLFLRQTVIFFYIAIGLADRRHDLLAVKYDLRAIPLDDLHVLLFLLQDFRTECLRAMTMSMIAQLPRNVNI